MSKYGSRLFVRRCSLKVPSICPGVLQSVQASLIKGQKRLFKKSAPASFDPSPNPHPRPWIRSQRLDSSPDPRTPLRIRGRIKGRRGGVRGRLRDAGADSGADPTRGPGGQKRFHGWTPKQATPSRQHLPSCCSLLSDDACIDNVLLSPRCFCCCCCCCCF